MEPINKYSRNAFVALCEYASKHNWCWKIHCTTCGHSDFRVAFSKLVRGQHPDNEEFWSKGKDKYSLCQERDQYNDFLSWDVSDSSQIKLADIVASSKILDIQSVSSFPNWLGYIGLVLSHCQHTDARKVISGALIPQFISMLENNGSDCKWLKEPNKVLSIKDLEIVERNFYKK